MEREAVRMVHLTAEQLDSLTAAQTARLSTAVDLARRQSRAHASRAAQQVRAAAAHELSRWPYVPVEERTPRRRLGNRRALFALVRELDVCCRYCMDAPAETIDHIVPLCRGGLDEPNNLVGSCSDCNTRKGDLLPVEAGMRLVASLRLIEACAPTRKQLRQIARR